MKILWAVLALFAAVSPVRLQGLKLTINEDPSNGASVVLQVNGSRSINLVPTLSYTILCEQSAGGFSGGVSPWFRDNSQISTTEPETSGVYAVRQSSLVWALMVKMFDDVLRGSYSCRMDSNSVTLVVGSGNPVAIAGQPFRAVDPGERFFPLDAFASGVPSPSLQWSRAQQVLSSDSEFLVDGNSLVVREVDRDSGGEYTFVVSNSAGSESDTITVLVIVGPEASIYPNTTQMIVNGTDLSLLCVDRVGNPRPSLVWRKDGVTLSENDRVGIVESSVAVNTTSSLTISPVLPSDGGNYQCIADNNPNDGEVFSRADVNVDVLFPPIVERHSSPQELWFTGEDVTLQARLVDANPSTDLTVVWRREGSLVPIPHTQLEVGNDTVYQLVIANVSRDLVGTYLCAVTNSIGTGSLEFTVMVYVAPTLGYITPPHYLVRDEAPLVTLTLRAEGAVPPVQPNQVTWQFNATTTLTLGGQKYSSSVVDGDQIRLNINNLELRDSGDYTLTVNHNAGNQSITVRVVVLRPPVPPTITFDTVVDACTARFDLTLPQTQSYNTAEVNYVVLESMDLSNSEGNDWIQVGNETSSGTVNVRIPGSRLETRFLLRGRSGNKFVGEGENFEITGQGITIYQPAHVNEITVQNILGEPLSNTSIHISWTLPTPNCFNFTFFKVTCTSTGGVDHEINSTIVSRTEVPVEGLVPNTYYNCSVTSTLRDVARGVIVTDTRAFMRGRTFTYPNNPPAIAPPELFPEVPPTMNTITVKFALPANHENISHYQVIVLRLDSSSDLPPTSPDLLYPPGFQFASYQDVHGEEANKTKSFPPYIAAEIAGADFDPVFTIGDNSGRDPRYTNEKLSPGIVYTAFLRAFPKTLLDFPSRRRRQDNLQNRQYDVFTSSNFIEPITTEPVPPPTGASRPAPVAIIVPVVVVCVILLIVSAVILFLLFYFWTMAKNRTLKFNNPDPKLAVDISNSSSFDSPPTYSQTETPDLGRKLVPNGNNFEMECRTNGLPTAGHAKFEPSGPISREDFESHVEKFDANRQLLFQEEFDWISAKSPWNPAEASNHPLNDDKNRYSNITAFDHSRVVLSVMDRQECSDYINANYIAGFKHPKEYIATQGPLEQTVVDFWRMVWEQNTATIIMLTNLVELGKVKCSQYWPHSNKVIYGNIKVTLEHSVVLPDYTIRNFTVESIATNESRTVLQFHYTKWPDYGTPKLAAPLLNFLRAVRSSNPSDVGPLIIHCSAGVGRSGTVIAIDYCLQQLDTTGTLDIRGFVSKMREQRNYMVQTEQQYTFIHYAILEAITYGTTSCVLTEFRPCLERLQQVNGENGHTLLSEEYARLGTVKTMVKKSSFQQRIKRKGAPPRHFDSSFHGGTSSITDNYSAHFLDGYFQSKQFIVCDGPSEDTVTRFWQMVWDEDCAYIVMLTPQDTEELLPYWPAVNETVHHGNIIVEVVKESAEHLHTRREVKLTNSKVGGISHNVVQYQFMGWTTQHLPGVPDFVSFVVDILRGAENLEKNRRILIHDIKSLGPSGIMCSLCHCIEKIRLERVVDVFQAVQRIQLQRPGSIESLQQYAFIYDCVYEFIRTHSENNTPC